MGAAQKSAPEPERSDATPHPGPRETSLWLVPAGEGAEAVAALIQELAAATGATPFAPHATVYGSLRAPLDRLDPILAEVARVTPPSTLRATGVGHSDEFFRCLFFELEPSPVVALRRRLATPLGRSPQDAARPHLSLLYAELPAAERRALSRLGAGWVPRAWYCDALALVAPRPSDDPDWRDVAGWRVVRRYPLAGVPGKRA